MSASPAGPVPVAAAPAADAVVRLGLPLRVAPAALRPLWPVAPLNGPARPVVHAGSVDVFLEALDIAAPGEIMVIDNGGRLDEACIGDLTALEVQGAGLAAIVLWGCHRDTAELRAIGLPVFSLGALPAGPAAARERGPQTAARALIGEAEVIPGDVVVADDDGVLFVSAVEWPAVADLAAAITATERRQAGFAASGTNLREQYAFADYLARRAADPGYTFRAHLRERGAAIEE